MQVCGCCERTLLVGEIFRMYRRRVGASLAVCAVCVHAAKARGWRAERGPAMRQMHVRPRKVTPLRVDVDACVYVPRRSIAVDNAQTRVPALV